MLEGLGALAALFILLPGFIGARIAQMMSARSKQTEFERIVEALSFSFFTYFIFSKLVSTQLPLSWNSGSNGAGGQHYVLVVDHKSFFFLVAIAVVLGAVWGFIQSHDLVSRVLRRLRLTERASRESLWNDVFLTQKTGYVQVGLADGRSAIGLLSNYSDSGDERAIFLKDASWVVEEGGDDTVVPGPTVDLLLTDRSKIQFVMFLKQERTQAAIGETPAAASQGPPATRG